MQNEPKSQIISILGAGWLGLPLANHFLSLGHVVQLATRSNERLEKLSESTNAELFQFDIEDLPRVSGFLESDSLIVNITSKNIEAFESFIEQVASSSIKQVLFISSTSVYESVNGVVTEDSNDENDMHPLYKIEQKFLSSNGFDTTILRLSGLVGYQRHPGRWFQNKAVSQPDAPTNLIHRDDCIGIIEATIQQKAWGEVFNGSATTHPSKREFYTAMRALVSEEPLEFDDSSELSYKIVSNKKVINQLAYDFIYPDLLQCKNFRVVL